MERCHDGIMRRARHPEPVLITSARENPDDEYDRRRKKYAIMMAIRAICVLVAGLTYRYSIWLAVACAVGGMVLPWCAVIIANDRPAQKHTQARTGRPGAGSERAITAGDDGRVVDG
jgi:hypothetical protein